MNNHPIPKQPTVHFKDGHPVTTSLAIAEAFDRQHKNVLQTIQSLDCSEEFNRLNFKLVEYRDGKGQNRPMYEVTRDGFLFVGMGFTGAAASAMKEAYITAFNAMEAQLSNLPRPGQVEALRLKRCQEELLKLHPIYSKLARYRAMPLSLAEVSRLMGWSGQNSVRRAYKKMAAIGLIDYAPDPLLAAAGRKGLEISKQRQLAKGGAS